MANLPSDGLPPEVQARFNVLRKSFVAGLANRWQEIAAAAQSGQEAELAAALHRLAGAAGSYGFESLGTQARQVEALASAGASASMSAALAGLEREIRHICAS